MKPFVAVLAILALVAPGLAARSGIQDRTGVLERNHLLSSPADTFTLIETWKLGVYSNGIGEAGIVAIDIDNDGTEEIVLSGATVTFGLNDFWYVLEYSSLTLEYEITWISELSSVEISTIAAFDTDGDSVASIFVGFSTGDIHVFDGVTMEKTREISSGGGALHRVLAGDGDNDGTKELAFCDNSTVFLYGLTSFSEEHQIPYGAGDFELGDVDGDPEIEIVLATGQVLEFDGDSVAIEWSYAGGDFGRLLELSDIDSDGMEEIIGADAWYYITVFDADIQSPKWQINADLDIGALLVADVVGDAAEEIIYGDGQWGEIHCYDAVTQTEAWLIDNPDHGVTNIALGDTDGDADLEIIWGAGATSTGADHLYVYGVPGLSHEWHNVHVDGPFHAIDVGDVDLDGDDEIVVISFESNSGYDDGVLFIFDAATHALEWKSDVDLFEGFAWTGVHDVAIGDVDDDGEEEIVVGTDRLYTGAIYVINGLSHAIEWSELYDDGAPIYSLYLADVDNDDDTEIVAGSGREHTGAPGVYVYVIDGSTGSVEWHSISIGDYWSTVYSVEVGDIDNDSVPEIVAINDHIFVFDGISHQQWQSSFADCYGLDLADMDGDGVEEIVAGTGTGHILSIDGQTWSEEFDLSVAPSRIDGLRVSDMDWNGRLELLFGSGGSLSAYSIQDSGMIWQSGNLGTAAGEGNAIVVSDFDSDDRTEVLIGTNYTVVEFEGPERQTAVKETAATDRPQFRLFQNSPNPVQRSTSIRYALDQPGWVRLCVYSSDGRLQTILSEGFQKVGTHSVVWDASRLASGLYFYRMETGGQSEVRKCVILR